MNSVTHILGGLALTSLLCLHTEILDPMEVGAAAMGVIGSLLPDIDHPKSKISNTTLTTKLASLSHHCRRQLAWCRGKQSEILLSCWEGRYGDTVSYGYGGIHVGTRRGKPGSANKGML